MFGWIKKRERFESTKLITQNKLAAMYLRDFLSKSSEAGFGGDPQLIFVLDAILDDVVDTSFKLRQGPLDPETFKNHFETNKQLRRLYDEMLAGRKAFAKQFGSATERIESFDRKFEPNEGWKIFIEHFR